MGKVTQENTRELWGGRALQRLPSYDDPYYAWYENNRERLQAEGQILVHPNPFGGPVEEFLKIGDFRIDRYVDTGYLYANPRLTTGASKEFFDGFLSSYFEEVEATFERRRELSYLPVANQLSAVMPKGGRLLEVGCGSGALMQVLRDEFGFVVEGNEISRTAAPYHQKRKQIVHECAIEDLPGAGQYDGVFMWSVADHFSDPMAAFQACFRLLRSGGVFFIGNINTDGFDISTIGSDSLVFAPPGRVNFFNMRSLRRQIEMAGFAVTAHQTVGKLDVSIVRDYWNGGGVNGRSAVLECIVLNDEMSSAREAFQDFLVTNHLSGFQTLVATR